MLTPTIPGREELLEECRASVAGQTVQVHEHLTLLDDEGLGCSTIMNTLADHAKGDWLFILADDDLMLPRCLELMLSVAGGAQIVYSPPLVWGEDPQQFCQSYPNIPAVALIAKGFWDLIGGYDTDLLATEDREFWVTAAMRSPEIRRYADNPTWVYRFHGGNKSRR